MLRAKFIQDHNLLSPPEPMRKKKKSTAVTSSSLPVISLATKGEEGGGETPPFTFTPKSLKYGGRLPDIGTKESDEKESPASPTKPILLSHREKSFGSRPAKRSPKARPNVTFGLLMDEDSHVSALSRSIACASPRMSIRASFRDGDLNLAPSGSLKSPKDASQANVLWKKLKAISANPLLLKMGLEPENRETFLSAKSVSFFSDNEKNESEGKRGKTRKNLPPSRGTKLLRAFVSCIGLAMSAMHRVRGGVGNVRFLTNRQYNIDCHTFDIKHFLRGEEFGVFQVPRGDTIMTFAIRPHQVHNWIISMMQMHDASQISHFFQCEASLAGIQYVTAAWSALSLSIIAKRMCVLTATDPEYIPVNEFIRFVHTFQDPGDQAIDYTVYEPEDAIQFQVGELPSLLTGQDLFSLPQQFQDTVRGISQRALAKLFYPRLLLAHAKVARKRLCEQGRKVAPRVQIEALQQQMMLWRVCIFDGGTSPCIDSRCVIRCVMGFTKV